MRHSFVLYDFLNNSLVFINNPETPVTHFSATDCRCATANDVRVGKYLSLVAHEAALK